MASATFWLTVHGPGTGSFSRRIRERCVVLSGGCPTWFPGKCACPLLLAPLIMLRLWSIRGFVGLLAAAFVAGSGTRAHGVSFARDIRPILADRCFSCHGPDADHREAELRLDTRQGIFEHEGVTIIEPGKLAASELWLRITHAEDSQRMPPVEVEKPLAQAELELIRAWIEEGAQWQEHWSFAVPARGQVPPTSDGSMSNPIDRFVAGRLASQGLEQSPPAAPETLIRRYSLAIVGLLPTWDEVETFCAGYRSDPELACAQLVDRLLESPHYGERMAIHWLDLVRFADTVGYHGDQDHSISPYRDYVIEAFNQNMPFDRFTEEQLAGDLLPNASIDARVASGYNRLLQTSHEGGIQQKEYLAKYSADRVRNYGSVWLGLTLGCAECHDHKFDPILQRDFYRLAAFFADVNDLRTFEGTNALPTQREPELEVLSSEDRRQQDEIRRELSELEGADPPNSRSAERSVLEERLRAIQGRARRAMITEAIAPRPIRVLARGNWMDETGELVEPGVPSLFGQLERTNRPTRLDLARWTTAKDHPLTGRVFVNRLWKLFFGRGLSSTLDDLGLQGGPPTHPELLDWLACEFIDRGWNVKHMVRLLVTSRTFRQASVETAALRQKDPENLLLSRQVCPRLEAELIRDVALQTSGLLVREIGGASARPYQPAGYYRNLNHPEREYVADPARQQYRRGVYTHWQRSYLHPMLKAFDAPSREECTARRSVSNTPQAALVLLNDPSFVESARVLAVRMMREGGSNPTERIRWVWRTALARNPRPQESLLLEKLFASEAADYRADPPSAQRLLEVGQTPAPGDLDPIELAAWTAVARGIYNLDEFITRN